MRISVVVATRNRAEALRGLLSSLETIERGKGWDWELIVVDNGSTDGTSGVLGEAAGRGGLPLRTFSEPRAGKPRALNAGLTHASGDIIAFTDDDCVVPGDWLEQIARQFREDASLAGIGGRVDLYDPLDAAITLRTDPERRELASPEELYGSVIGCNMAFRRRVLDELGGFDPLVGPGAPVPSGNDVDLVYRALRAGRRVVYEPRIGMYHHHGRQSPEAVMEVARRYTRGRGAFYCKFALAGDRAVMRMAVREVLGALGRLVAGPGRGDARPAQRPLAHIVALVSGASTRLRLAISGATRRPS